MDSHDRHDRLLTAFLAGDLDPADARRWDEHLLECERCWRAVREDRAGKQAAQLMRQPVPSGLADRVAFAVEVASAERSVEAPQAIPLASPRHGRHATRRSWRLAAAGLTVASVAAGLIVALVPGGHETPVCRRQWRRWRVTHRRSQPRPGARTGIHACQLRRLRSAARQG